MRPFINRKNRFISLRKPVFQHMNITYYSYYSIYINSIREEESSQEIAHNNKNLSFLPDQVR